MTVVIIILSIILCVSLFYNIKFGRMIFRMNDSVENALDVCDNSYQTMSNILSTPLASDSVETKMFIASLKNVRDSILVISNIVAEPFDGVTEEEDGSA